MSLFDFDYDLSWQALLLTPDGAVLGRFGGREPDVPAKYHSLAGLRHSLAAGLKAFSQRDRLDKPLARKTDYAENYPASERRPETACIHCHHVHEFRRDQLQREGRWNLDEVWIYPQPENVGITLDPDQGDRVLRVHPKSPAAELGLAAKDLLRRVNGMPIASVMDVQYALHKAPRAGEVQLAWRRGSEEKKGVLKIAEGWKKTDVSWRWSLKSLSPNPSIIGDDLDLDARKALGLDAKQLAYRHMNFLTPVARHAGLQANDVIVGVDGVSLSMTARQFETHLRLNFRVGQEITLNVLRGKDRIQLKLKLPE